MFSEKQKADLGAPLSASNVKGRKQGGRQVSYIEGWKVIEEANRIFGFDGWTRETIDIKCVAEISREIGESKAPGHGVSYIAKVKVVVFAGDLSVTREGVGAGHGIDRDLGQAHESAIKEAETDAMKRALMTFGYPFGLALYDKQQEHVVSDVATKPSTGPLWAILTSINACATSDKLDEYVSSPAAQEAYRKLGAEDQKKVLAAKNARYLQLEEAAA
jgi:DNA repair and recombination protein RAD52